MTTSWHGKSFPITGASLGESTDDLWIPLTKGQWWQLCGAFMFSLMLAWTSCWVNIQVFVDLRCHDVKGIYRWTVDSLTQSANNTSKVDFYVFIHVSVHKVLGKHSSFFLLKCHDAHMTSDYRYTCDYVHIVIAVSHFRIEIELHNALEFWR